MIPAISIKNAGKKFGKEWIFRNITVDIAPRSRTVILGGNGSGKSTLLQVISGFITLNEGAVTYARQSGIVPDDDVRRLVSFASPYLQLIEEFTATELIAHAQRFKAFQVNEPAHRILELLRLPKPWDRQVKHFSSGMKQKLRLGLAILSDAPVLLLDEPVSNLDRDAIEWYGNMMTSYTSDKTVVICSNAIHAEYAGCTSQINISDYKKTTAILS